MPPEVIGFIAQCATCPQRAVLRLQPVTGWQCPRCVAPTVQPPRIESTEPDDWPIGEVIG